MSNQEPASENGVVKVLALGGPVGCGVDETALAIGLQHQPDIIVVDGGFAECDMRTLGAGAALFDRAACEADWRTLLAAREEANAPLVLGSAGGSGVDEMVEWKAALTAEIAEAEGASWRVATVKTSQDPGAIGDHWLCGLVDPMIADAPEVDDEALRSFAHIVAQAGAEHAMGALDTGADVVIMGRAPRSAGAAALPLLRGANEAAARHAARIAGFGSVVLSVDASGFTVEALCEAARMAQEDLAAHAAALSRCPLTAHEPGGRLEFDDARYEAQGARRAFGSGSGWTPAKPYRLRLEAARPSADQGGYEAVLQHTMAMMKPWDACSLNSFEVGAPQAVCAAG